MEAFNTDSMNKTYKVGGKELVLKPLKVKVYKQLVAKVVETIDNMQKIDKNASVSVLVDSIIDTNFEVVKLVFPDQPFITKEWWEENMDLATAFDMVKTIVVAGRLDRVFPFLRNLTE